MGVRCYRLADLAVRKRRSRKLLKLERVALQECHAINEVWSMDFLAGGRRIKCLTVTDDFSHECVDIAIDHGISGEYVTRILDRAARFRGYPKAVRTDLILDPQWNRDRPGYPPLVELAWQETGRDQAECRGVLPRLAGRPSRVQELLPHRWQPITAS